MKLNLKQKTILTIFAAMLSLPSFGASCVTYYEDRASSATSDIDASAPGLIFFGLTSPLLIHATIKRNEANEMIQLIKESREGWGETLGHLYDKLDGYVALTPDELADIIKKADKSEYLCSAGPFNFNKLKKGLRKGTVQRDLKALKLI